MTADSGENLTEQELNDMFSEVDTDGDGAVSNHEFAKMMAASWDF